MHILDTLKHVLMIGTVVVDFGEFAAVCISEFSFGVSDTEPRHFVSGVATAKTPYEDFQDKMRSSSRVSH